MSEELTKKRAFVRSQAFVRVLACILCFGSLGCSREGTVAGISISDIGGLARGEERKIDIFVRFWSPDQEYAGTKVEVRVACDDGDVEFHPRVSTIDLDTTVLASQWSMSE